ncbi:MAG: DNA alkylation repair protein [Candidatus Moranbacteria bacterium]|nr:DNA alkylation repair protein [Candidatus Moranbacteria bacterium]
MRSEHAVRQALRRVSRKDKAAILARFFKTGKGEYAEGDRFLGITVPQIRSLVRQYDALSVQEILTFLHSSFHEERLFALLVLVRQYERGDIKTRNKIYRLYLDNTRFINNWDLVDLSAHHIVGAHLEKKERKILDRLARSESLWERRIAMIATFYFTNQGDASPALAIAEKLIDDKQDLIHKAVGWMLREVGKRCSLQEEKMFLERYAKTMPRTALRYALERMNAREKKYFMERKKYA